VIDDDSEDGGCDEVIGLRAGWDESELNEVDGMKKGADSTGEVMHSKKSHGNKGREAGSTCRLNKWTDIRLCM